MTEHVNVEEVWRAIRETDRQLKETAERQKETDHQRQESERLLKAQLAETDRQRKERERFLEAQFAETDRRMQETDRKLRAVGEQIGGLGNRLGDFVEGVIKPGLVRLFCERGLEVRETSRDWQARQGDVAAQLDLVVMDGDVAVIVEVKSKLTNERVDEHLERMDKVRCLFPRLAQMKLLGAVAAMVIPDDVALYAEKHGLFVIGQSGEDAVFLNAKDFLPRSW